MDQTIIVLILCNMGKGNFPHCSVYSILNTLIKGLYLYYKIKMVIDITHPAISFNRETDTFSVELSDVKDFNFKGTSLFEFCDRGYNIKLYNPKSGVTIDTRRVRVDMDGSQEDTYGWMYQSVDWSGAKRITNFLFIND